MCIPRKCAADARSRFPARNPAQEAEFMKENSRLVSFAKTFTCTDCYQVFSLSEVVVQCDDEGQDEEVCERCSSVRDTRALF
jgi:hypothetical protein